MSEQIKDGKSPVFINTGSKHWDAAAYRAWCEGNIPGSSNWMMRIREFLAAREAKS